MRARAGKPLRTPVLAIGGRYGMGTAVAHSLRTVAAHVEDLQVPSAGHYPAEQHPQTVNPRLAAFLRRHSGARQT